MMQSFDQEFKTRVAYAEALLTEALPAEEGLQKTIFTAMKYSVMAGGKRLRPLLIMETYRYFGGEDLEKVKPFMAAIEMIHTYSLIHDDLPALDNDDYRRGRLTSHKVFGEAMAILAGDALLNYAYETAAKALREAPDYDSLKAAARAMDILCRKPGVYGMIGGQVVDVELTGQPIDADTMNFIFDLKTGALIEACMMIGAALAGQDDATLARVEEAAHCIGMAFQIQDDILDVTSTLEELGKPVHSDEKNAKTTWVSLYGMEKARADVAAYSAKALDILAAMDGVTAPQDSFLYAFVTWLITRKK